MTGGARVRGGLTEIPGFSEIALEGDTWLTVEICVLADSPQATHLKEICAEMCARGLPVYVSISKRGTSYKAGRRDARSVGYLEE